jgi:hypothetical protein
MSTDYIAFLKEMRRLIVEGAADLFVDHELSDVCAFDLNRYCNEIPPGASQRKFFSF